MDLVCSRYVLESTPGEDGECSDWLTTNRVQMGAILPSRKRVDGLLVWLRAGRNLFLRKDLL